MLRLTGSKIKICHLTINTIDYERRIKNQAESASKLGDIVWIIALGKPGDKHENTYDSYYLKRIKTPFFKGGPLKFIHYNIKVFFFLLSKPLEILHCHDLWTIPAAFVLRQIKEFKFIYDAHEYFAGLEIFNKNKIRKKFWMFVERIAIKHIDVLITVSEPIAELYRQKYPDLRNIEVIRNLPKKEIDPGKSKHGYLPETRKKIVLYQGHFKPGRGLLQLIEAMSFIEEAHLVLIGGGELENDIRKKIKDLNIEKRISIIEYLPTGQLITAAAGADLGIVLFERTSLNYSYALPNKFFEYMMSGIPVLASNIETLKDYTEKYGTGLTVDPEDVNGIVAAIKMMLSDEKKIEQWRKNVRRATQLLNWENESGKMNQIYEKFRN